MAIPNVQVSPGAPLLQIDPAGEESADRNEVRVYFPATSATMSMIREARRRHNLEELRQLMLGFDISLRADQAVAGRMETMA